LSQLARLVQGIKHNLPNGGHSSSRFDTRFIYPEFLTIYSAEVERFDHPAGRLEKTFRCFRRDSKPGSQKM
jgi:hypothetical protein